MPNRFRTALSMLAASSLVAIGVFSSAAAAQAAGETEDMRLDAQILAAVNNERGKAGLDPVYQDLTGALRDTSLDWSTHMSQTNDFNHDPNLQSKINGANCLIPAAENIQWVGPGGTLTGSQIVQRYMDSPGHRANILNPSYRYMASGSVKSSAGLTWNTMRFASACGDLYDTQAINWPMLPAERDIDAELGTPHVIKNVRVQPGDGRTVYLQELSGQNNMVRTPVDQFPADGVARNITIPADELGTHTYRLVTARTMQAHMWASPTITVNVTRPGSKFAGWTGEAINVEDGQAPLKRTVNVAPAYGQTVTFQKNINGSGWQDVSTHTANGNSFTVSLPAGPIGTYNEYRLIADETDETKRTVSGTVTLNTVAYPTTVTGWFPGDKTVTAGSNLVANISVNVEGGERTAILTRKNADGSWETVEIETTVKGKTTFNIPTDVSGKFTYRLQINGNSMSDPWTSPLTSITVNKATSKISGWSTTQADVKIGETVKQSVTVTPGYDREIWLQENKSGKWTTISKRAASSGTITIPAASTEVLRIFRVYAPATASAKEVASGEKYVVSGKAKSKVTGWPTGTKTVKYKASTLSYTVTVAPAEARTLYAQRYINGKWSTYKTYKTNSSGKVKVALPANTRMGTTSYRVQAPDTSKNTAVTSSTFKIKVAKAATKVSSYSTKTKTIKVKKTTKQSASLNTKVKRTVYIQQSVNGKVSNVHKVTTTSAGKFTFKTGTSKTAKTIKYRVYAPATTNYDKAYGKWWSIKFKK